MNEWHAEWHKRQHETRKLAHLFKASWELKWIECEDEAAPDVSVSEPEWIGSSSSFPSKSAGKDDSLLPVLHRMAA